MSRPSVTASTVDASVDVPDRVVILNTGRCGSTLLSELIAQEPDTASISESLNVAATATQDIMCTGAEFWSATGGRSLQLSTQVRIGLLADEFRYPADGRWGSDLADLPAILATTLPSVSADPDGLYDELARRVPHFPPQWRSAHYIMLLDLIATLTGRRRWVERTGGSCTVADAVLRAVPSAKVVYLTRDVADTARSMSRHPGFQFAALRLQFRARCGIDPYSPGVDDQAIAQRVPPDLRDRLPEEITAETFWAKGHSARWFMGLCEAMRERTERALTDWDPARLHRMRYEDLVTDPDGELVRLGRFLDFADPQDWASRVAHRVRRRHG